MMKDDEDWAAQFAAIDALRVCNKFHSSDLAENLDTFTDFIKASVDNLRSNVCKNALQFCQELFTNDKIVREAKFRE